MPKVKHLFSIFCFLFVFLSTNSFGHANKNTFTNHQQKFSGQHTSEITSSSFNELKGVLQPSIRLVESNIPGCQALKNSKKISTLHFFFTSDKNLNTHYQHYFLRGLNNFSSYPFYIAFHRLII